MLGLSAVVERAMRRARRRCDLSLVQRWLARRAIIAALYNPDGRVTQPFHYFDITGLRYALMRSASLRLLRLFSPTFISPPVFAFACVWLAV